MTFTKELVPGDYDVRLYYNWLDGSEEGGRFNIVGRHSFTVALEATRAPVLDQVGLPHVEAHPAEGDAPLAVDFSFGVPRGMSVSSIALDYGDDTLHDEWGQTRPRWVPHVFQRPGRYTVTLTITDTTGHSVQTSVEVRVTDSGDLPVAEAERRLEAQAGDPVCQQGENGLECSYDTAGPDADGIPLPRQWVRDDDDACRATGA